MNAQQVKKISETGPVFHAPESVAFDSLNNCLYVSNYTEPLTEGGKYMQHSISKIDMQGNFISEEWIKGVSCPTGICMHNKKLYVVERFGVVECDPSLGTITNHYYIKTTDFLNDITYDNEGNLYVSVSGTPRIYRILIDSARVEVWVEDQRLLDPNGILFDNGVILIGVNSDG